MSAASKYCHLKSQENWQLFFRLEHPFRKSNCRGKGWCWNEDPHKHWRQDCEEDFVLRSWPIGQDCCSEDRTYWTEQVGQTGLGHDQHEKPRRTWDQVIFCGEVRFEAQGRGGRMRLVQHPREVWRGVTLLTARGDSRNHELRSGVHKKPQKFIFEYWVFSQKPYLNVGCFEEIHICIPKIRYLHTS